MFTQINDFQSRSLNVYKMSNDNVIRDVGDAVKVDALKDYLL